MSMVREVSVSCAELKLVTVRVARPRQRSTVGGRVQTWGSGPRARAAVGGQVRHEVRNSKGTRATGVAELGQGSLGSSSPSQGVLGVRGSQATCLALCLSVPSPSSPPGLSGLLTLINDN